LLDHYNYKRSKGRFITFSALDPYENSWRITGVCELLTYMLDEPDFVHALFQAQAELIIESAKAMMDMGIKFDCAWFWGDIAYRSGPLFFF